MISLVALTIASKLVILETGGVVGSLRKQPHPASENSPSLYEDVDWKESKPHTVIHLLRIARSPPKLHPEIRTQALISAIE